MRYMTLLIALSAAGCGGSTTAPSAPPVVTPPVVVVPPPVIVSMIAVSACPTEAPIDVAFYREIGCGVFDNPIQPVRRWTTAPKLYIRTVDEAGAAIDAVTLDTTQRAMTEIAPVWTGGRFSLAVERGSDSRENASGWITVKWLTTIPASGSCGQSDVARDGGTIELNYKVASCGCNGSAMRPRTARHELGHALGYYHTDSAADLMSGLGVPGCDASPSARELQAASYQYR